MKKNVIQLSPTKFILKGSREYSLYVAQQRAIPKTTDGLKSSQRIALWLLRNRADKIKTVGLGGEMASQRLYVHGDISATNAIGLLAAPYKNNIRLIEGIGCFGTRTKPTEIGAPRYTEVKRSLAAQHFLYVDLPLVPLEDNYDGSNKQPVHFLPIIPTVLLNGIVGVAVGFSTDILPRSLISLINSCQAALRGNKFDEPTPYFQNYDVRVNNIGINQWEILGKVDVVNSSTFKVTELPPGLSLEAFKKRLIIMEDEEKIANFSDASSDSILVEIQMKRGSVRGWTEAQAIDFLKLRERTTERIVVVDWDGTKIRTYPNPSDLIKDFVEWRLAWYEKRYQRYLDDTTYELNYWYVLRALFQDGFTKRLGTFADRTAVEADVTKVATKKKLKLDDRQLDRVVSLPTYRWTKAFEGEIAAKIIELEANIAEYKAILASPDRRRDIYIGELEALKKIKF